MELDLKLLGIDHDMVGGGQEDREWENNCVWRLKKVRQKIICEDKL